MSTVRDIIKGSLRVIGAISTGETPTADEQSDALSVLNDMIDSWSNESLFIYATVREVFDLIPSQQVYTIGASGNFNTSRPMKIEQALIQVQGSNPNFELPIKIVNQQQFSDISVKSTASSIPTRMYVEGTYPLENINLWPVPNVAHKIVFYSVKPLTTFTTANDSISLPPGYLKALKYNLAIELAPEYGKEPSQTIIQMAMEAKENIKRTNIKESIMGVDAGLSRLGKTFNFLTGE